MDVMSYKRNMSFSYVFLDLSYYVIHKYFGVLSWQKLSKLELTPEELRERFTKAFEETLVKIKKKHKFEWCRLYVAKDTPRDTIWRNQLFPSYKDRAVTLRSDFDPTIFPHVYEVLLPMLREKYGGFTLLSTHAAEADDIVAIAHRKIRREDPSATLLVITNDNDYVQLVDDCTLIINANMVELKSRFDAEMMSVYTLWKVIKGDVSDCIPSIAKKIGEKTALKLALDPELLAKKLAHSDARKQFELNKALISFESIPPSIVGEIEAMLKPLLR